MTEPTLWEVIRRLDEVSKRLDDMTKRMDERDKSLVDQYVPRREYELRVGEVEKDMAAQSTFRRQVGAGAAVGLILLVANLLIALSRVPGVSA